MLVFRVLIEMMNQYIYEVFSQEYSEVDSYCYFLDIFKL